MEKWTVESIMQLARSCESRYSNRMRGPDRHAEINEGRLTEARQALEVALTEVCAQRDQWQRFHKELCRDFSTDMECLPECDSFAHAELCPVTNTQEAWRKMKADLAACREENQRLREAVQAFLAKVEIYWPQD